MIKRYDENSINDFRNYYVAISNDFAQSSCYSYSLHSHRLMMYTLAKIPSYDGSFTNYAEYIDIDLGHVIAVFNLPSSGATYNRFREALEQMCHSPVFENNTFLEGCLQISKTMYRVKINPTLRKHFFDLDSDYVQFSLMNIICFRCEYSFQIYTALLSRFKRAEYLFGKTGGSKKGFQYSFSYSPDVYLRMLCLTQPSYHEYRSLNAAVIKKTCNEINRYSDIMTFYSGTRYEIRRTIRHKTSDENMTAYLCVLEFLA